MGRNSKIVIVGTGFVGTSYAYSLVNNNTAKEIILIDIDPKKAVGEALDLSHGVPFTKSNTIVRAGNYDDCNNADIVVITAGVNQKPGETRIDLLKRNATIMKSIVGEINNTLFDGIMLIASNPVDILSYICWKESRLPRHKVIGSGTALDSARLQYELSKKIGVAPQNVNSFILGEHGDSEFACWSNTTISVKPIKDVIATTNGISFDDFDEIYRNVKDSASNIIAAKQATYYGVGLALNRITEIILNDERVIIPISQHIDGDYENIKDIYIGIPAILGSQGVIKTIHLSLSDDEKEKLKKSYDILHEQLVSIGYKD